jgi:hypothetical protein
MITSMFSAGAKSAGRVAAVAAFSLSLVGLSGASASAVVFTLAVNSNSGKCLDVPENSTSNNQGIEQFTCNTGGNQLWTRDFVSSGVTRIRNENSRKCLDVRDDSLNNNAVVVQNDCNTAFSQDWILLADPNGLGFQVVGRHSGKCLTVANSSLADKAGIVQFTCTTGRRSQIWAFG